MIRLENVTFAYSEETILEEIAFTEEEPVITGLWGRNGSGKTTLMKLLAGHQKPTAGNIEVFGHSPFNNLDIVKDICYMEEDHPFSIIWTVEDALRFGRYFNPNWHQETADRLLKLFNLPRNKKVTKLSKGMKTAVQITIGLASHAKVTILDEPTNGLDAGIRKKFYQALKESYEENPRFILLSSHHIEEIQPLCESLVVIHNQKIFLHEEMEIIREKGFWLTGNQEKVEAVIKNERVLERNTMGKMLKVMMLATYSKEWEQIARENGLSVEKAQVQDYLLNLTDGGVLDEHN
ncbi:ABC transporter ATP-binding protein [Oceanobacillus jordanicus]|uniref:ABC transporter ATP-binding protein n=1 Tax=Oceanobacillus jordanicus TaxID=2867266 RepID=A0AAW5B7J7_9BACI|nr:ABC transporter ATP-binding protein [Oceanobacillus jordanicus]MCG3419194.1 ABC transporter ATP-binding protein [Oceanobacillus jordanicus]